MNSQKNRFCLRTFRVKTFYQRTRRKNMQPSSFNMHCSALLPLTPVMTTIYTHTCTYARRRVGSEKEGEKENDRFFQKDLLELQPSAPSLMCPLKSRKNDTRTILECCVLNQHCINENFVFL